MQAHKQNKNKDTVTNIPQTEQHTYNGKHCTSNKNRKHNTNTNQRKPNTQPQQQTNTKHSKTT